MNGYISYLLLIMICLFSTTACMDTDEQQIGEPINFEQELKESIKILTPKWAKEKRQFKYAFRVYPTDDECFFICTMVEDNSKKNEESQELSLDMLQKAMVMNHEMCKKVRPDRFDWFGPSDTVAKIGKHNLALRNYFQEKNKEDANYPTAVIPMRNELPPHEWQQVFDGENTIYVIPDQNILRAILKAKGTKCWAEKEWQIKHEQAQSAPLEGKTIRHFLGYYTYWHKYDKQMEGHLKTTYGPYKLPVLAIDKQKVVTLLQRIQQQQKKEKQQKKKELKEQQGNGSFRNFFLGLKLLIAQSL